MATLWESNCPFGFLLVMIPLGSSYFVFVFLSLLMSLMGGVGKLYRFLIIAFLSISRQLALWGKEKNFEILFFQDGIHLGFAIGTILPIFDLHVTLMPPTKFQLNWHFR